MRLGWRCLGLGKRGDGEGLIDPTLLLLNITLGKVELPCCLREPDAPT